MFPMVLAMFPIGTSQFCRCCATIKSEKVSATNDRLLSLVHRMFTKTQPAFCWKNVRCKVKGGSEQQRARFYRGARFRISLILSHRNLVGSSLPQTLLYAAWRLRQPRPATELCKLYRRARFWKSPELKPAPAANTEEIFLAAILNKRQIFVRCKVKGQSIGTKPEADSLS